MGAKQTIVRPIKKGGHAPKAASPHPHPHPPPPPPHTHTLSPEPSAYIHLRFKHAVLGSICLGCLSRTVLVVKEREEGIVALHQPIGLLKTCSGLEPVPAPPFADVIVTAPSGPV